ncbi:hypothetical protein AUJ14_04530 [Candidatus Micrarchaeota archaeon CG1_02_55_22]|nr:MAG: hypothetical protein AUJ14_04530 [Candidatus Micrarchaeota archaeon CG1_02_55_22]
MVALAQKVFQVSEDLHRRVKILAIHENKKLAEIAEKLLEVGLEHYELESQKGNPKKSFDGTVRHPFSDQI